MSKTLVAFFSPTGTTRKLAQKVAIATNADLFEIVPETPYTDDDLNWQDPKSRSSIEMGENKAYRPPISSKVENISQYDVIIIGFPIWWYVCPTIINSFVESYDFTGKKIALFATSGMSDIDKTPGVLQSSLNGAPIVGQKRFNSNATQDAVAQWVKSMNL